MAKPSWPVKAEIVLLIAGIAGALFMLLVLLNWRALPAQVTENFRGGTLGAQQLPSQSLQGFWVSSS